MKSFHLPLFYLQDKLTAEHLGFFKTHGFIHFKNFVSKDTVRSFLGEIKNVQDQLIQSNTEKINGIPLKFGQDVDGSLFIQRIAFASQYSKTLSDFLKDPHFNAILQLLGSFEGRVGEFEKDGLVVNHYVNTKNSAFTRMGWHTDSPRDLFLGSRILPMLNVGLHLDDCPIENGGLRVLPGTHTQGLLRLLFRKKYFIDNEPDKDEVGFNIEAGDLTIHDGRLWHRVQQSPFEGERTRRRVMYIPVITGAPKYKNADSATPFYHKLAKFGHNPNGKINWSLAEGKSVIARNAINVN